MSSRTKQLRTSSQDGNTNDDHQMREASTHFVPPAISKVDEVERGICRTQEKETEWANRFQAKLDDLRGAQRNARAELETKVQLAQEEAEKTREAERQAEENLRQAEENLKQALELVQKGRSNLHAKRVMNTEAMEHVQKCRDEQHATQIKNMEANSVVEELRRNMHSQAAAKLAKANREMLDDARRKEMTRDASAAGEDA